MNNNQTFLKVADIKEMSVATRAGLLFFSLLLTSCATTMGPAPVVERAVVPAGGAERMAPASAQTNQFYTVQRGDTLYGIALKHGINQKDLAEWNNIADPHSIRPGQRINLSLSSASNGNTGPTLFAVPQQSTMPIVDPASVSTHYSASHESTSEAIKTSPQAVKLPYSEQNVAHVQHPSLDTPGLEQTAAVGSGTRVENAPAPQAQRTDLAMHAPATDWIWPVNGRLLSSFSTNSKGLKISGQIGQAVVATAAGEVVYSGDGLRGYGNLIIIKHSDALLSAYAHNSKLLVREGETVTQGQKIAEIGNTDTDTPQLHFEIRRHGKPVDPLEFLPGNPG